MINIRSKIEIVTACSMIVLILLIVSHEVSTLETDHDEMFIRKRMTSYNNHEKERGENSNFRKIWKRTEEFPDEKINDYGINKEEDELVTRDDETNQLRSNKIESDINLNDWKRHFSVFMKDNEVFQRPSYSNEKLTRKINENIKEENDSNDLTLSRNIRSINKTDYYAQRKAVIDKYHARQREITTKYGKRYNNNTSKIVHKKDQTLNETTKIFKNTNHPNLDIFKVISNDSSFGPKLNNKINRNEENTEKKRSWISDNSLRDITNYTSELNNRIKQDERNTEKKGTWISENSLRDVTNYSLPINHNCKNITLHSTYSKQARNQVTVSCLNNQNELIVKKVNESLAARPIRAIDGNLIWGTCNGTLVYQHNLSLNLHGPSILEALFDVIIDGPFCITCITILPYKGTKENVSKDSGGQGHNYVKIKFIGSKNEGFSYIIKVWAVAKTGSDCA